MATAKEGIIATALNAVKDAVMNPPLAVNNTTSPSKRSTSPTSKKTPVKKAATKMDRKLVSTMEDYEVKYLAQKHGVTQKAVREAVAKVGHSRNKVEAELKARTVK